MPFTPMVLPARSVQRSGLSSGPSIVLAPSRLTVWVAPSLRTTRLVGQLRLWTVPLISTVVAWTRTVAVAWGVWVGSTRTSRARIVPLGWREPSIFTERFGTRSAHANFWSLGPSTSVPTASTTVREVPLLTTTRALPAQAVLMVPATSISAAEVEVSGVGDGLPTEDGEKGMGNPDDSGDQPPKAPASARPLPLSSMSARASVAARATSADRAHQRVKALAMRLPKPIC